MACDLHTSQFLPVVEKLLQLRPDTYRYFDETAKFLLKADRSAPGRVQGIAQSIAHVAHIYDQLSTLDTEQKFVRGNLHNIQQLENLLDQPELYLQTVSDLLSAGPARTSQPTTLDEINQEVQSLPGADELLMTDLGRLLSLMTRYLDSNTWASPAQKVQVAKDLASRVDGMLGVNNPFLPLLQQKLEQFREQHIPREGFIPLDEVAELVGLNTFLGTLLNDQRVELIGVEDQGSLRYFRNDGEQQEITLDQLKSLVPARPASTGKNNQGLNVFEWGELGSAFVVKAINETDQVKLEEELNSLGSKINGRITLRALPLESFTDERVSRIQGLALEDSRYEALARRQHETFENQHQLKRLEKGLPILTVRRPVREQDQFQLLGEVNGLQFVLYAPTTYTIVYPDNTTQAVDFTNPADRELVRQLAVVRTPIDGQMPLSEAHLDRLAQSALLYQAFQKEVSQQLDMNGETQDITGLFQQFYQFAGQDRNKRRITLQEHIDRKGDAVATPLTVVKVLGDDTIVEGSSQQKMMPLAFFRERNQPFKPIHALQADERILHSDGFTYTYQAYVEQVLGITNEVLLSEYFKNDHERTYAQGILLYDGGNEELRVKQGKPRKAYNTLVARRPLEQIGETAMFLTQWEDQRKLPLGGGNSWQDFTQQKWRLSFKNDMTLNFDVERKGANAGAPILELRGLNNAGGSIGARLFKARPNFALDRARVDGLLDPLRGKNSPDPELINDLKKEFPQLSKLDLSNNDHLRQFYQQVSTLVTDPKSSLFERVEALNHHVDLSLGSLLYDSLFKKPGFFKRVIDLAAGNDDTLAADVMARHFNAEANEDQSYLLAVEYLRQPAGADPATRQYVAQVQYGAHANVVRRLDQYHVVTSDPKSDVGFSVVPASSAHRPDSNLTPEQPASAATTPAPDAPAPTPAPVVVQPAASVQPAPQPVVPEQLAPAPTGESLFDMPGTSYESYHLLEFESGADTAEMVAVRAQALELQAQFISLQQQVDVAARQPGADRLFTQLKEQRDEIEFKLNKLTEQVMGARQEAFKQSPLYKKAQETVATLQAIRSDDVTYSQRIGLDILRDLLKGKFGLRSSIQSAIDSVKSTPEPTSAPADDFDDPFNDAPARTVLSLQQVISRPVGRLQLQEQIAIMRQLLPQFEISEADIEEILDLSQYDGRVSGAFLDKIIYLNRVLSESGTVYHEGFHGVFRYLLNSPARLELTTGIIKDKKYRSLFTEDALRDFARKRNQPYNENTKHLQAEEILADAFRDYMLAGKKKAPSKWQRLFELLKNLFNLSAYRAQRRRESLFSDIQEGRYATVAVQPGSSDLFAGQVVLELLPGIEEFVIDPATGKIARDTVQISVYDQQQLVSRLVHQIINDDTPGLSFEKKFELHRKNLYNTVYNVHYWTKAEGVTPDQKARIERKYGRMWGNMQFLLGMAVDGQEMLMGNTTGDPRGDGRPVKDKGQGSLELLEKLVKKEIFQMSHRHMIQELADRDPRYSTALDLMDGERVVTEQEQEELEEKPDSDFDTNNNEHNRLQSLSSSLRKFFGYVSYTELDPETMLNVPVMADGQGVFATLMKITSDVQPEHILSTIERRITQYREDGYLREAKMIEAVYRKFADTVGLDKQTFLPTINHQLYNQFIDAFHGTERQYLVDTIKTTVQTEKGLGKEGQIWSSSSSIKDALLKQDVFQKRKQLTTGLVERYNTYLAQPAGQDPAYEQALKEITRLSKIIADSKNISVLFSGDKVKILKEMTDELHKNLAIIGLPLPKSLIRYSLIAIDSLENKRGRFLDPGSPEQQHYEEHLPMARNGQYLEKAYFKQLHTISTQMSNRATQQGIFELVDPDGTGTTSSVYNNVTSKFAVYLVKYDPMQVLSTTKNGEGKPIYRYVKYTPADTITQDIRQHERGLEGHLERDPYYQSHLRNWYLDNALTGAALKNDGSLESERAKLFFENLRVDTWGSIRQTLDGQLREGVSYKNADDKGLYLNYLNFFLNRNEISKTVTITDPKTGAKSEQLISLTTYNRTLTQLEASSTNFVVTALYHEHVGRTGKPVLHHGFNRIVETLENTVGQEFNRMRREWTTREQILDGEKQGINKYNAVGTLDAPNVDNIKSLRAYQFNLLPDFFKSNPKLEDSLRKAALEGERSFEDILSGELGKSLRQQLHEYSEQKYAEHLDQLVSLGVITRTTGPDYLRVNGVMVPVDGEDTTTLATEAKDGKRWALKSEELRNIYKSSFIPRMFDYNGKRARKDSGLNEFYGVSQDGSNIENLIRDSYFNYFENSLLVNQVFDGDIALSIKNPIDYFKRNKALLAAGSTLKAGTHRVAVMDTLRLLVDPDNIESGQFHSLQDIADQAQDALDQGDTDRAEMLLESYRNIEEKMYAVKDDGSVDNQTRSSVWTMVFDGQSLALHMHQIDMVESLGRLGQGYVQGKPVSFLDLLIAKTYRRLTSEEINVLEAGGVVHNSKKTVTASRLQYHKQSEHLIDRGDVSHLITRLNPGERGYEEEVARLHQELHERQMEIYFLRQQRNQLHVDALLQDGHPNSENVAGSGELLSLIQQKTLEVHRYFRPKRARKHLHDLLNSMEYHQIDQVFDTEATKKLTSLPVALDDYEHAREGSQDRYIRFDLAQSDVDNRFKYVQVETSGVHDEVKAGVQAKVLITADAKQLHDQILADPEKSEEEKNAAREILEITERYQQSLTNLTASKLRKLQKFLRGEDGNFDVAEVFTMIRQSLQDQGADTNKLKWFELDEAGQPKHGTNMPQVRRMLEYYFFSIYSNNVTDEKVSGFKAFHVTSYGYQLTYNRRTGAVIPQSEVDKNPAYYDDESLFGVRYPGVRSQINAQGNKQYFVEVLMARPQFESDQHEQYWREHLAQMFATRIPTEDKRSMIALQVVDFIDESYRNTVIVPQLVHLLSGSDLDIDSLYGQKFATYREWMLHKDSRDREGDASKYRKYGDYSGLSGTALNIRRYTEYLTHLTSQPDIRSAIKQELEVMGELGPRQQDFFSEGTREILGMLGYDEDEIRNAAITPYNTSYAEEQLSELQADTNGRDISDEEAFEQRQIAQLLSEGHSLQEIRRNIIKFTPDQIENERVRQARARYRQARTTFQLAKMSARIEASLRVLTRLTGLPTTLSEFLRDDTGAGFITPAHQNDALQARLDLLSNAAVFKNLYIHEKQSTERLGRILTHLGRSATEMAGKYNPYTIDGVLAMRSANAMNKTGIALTANINKFLAVASQYELKLKDQHVIWNVATQKLDEDGVVQWANRTYREFGGIDEEGIRAIAHVGNILGIFADGAKDPIPTALKMNEVNAGTTLAMIGLGLPIEAAVYLNFLPEIRKAVARVQESEQAVSMKYESQPRQLHSEIGDVLYQEFFSVLGKGSNTYYEEVPERVAILKELQLAGVLKENKTSTRNFQVDPSLVQINFQVPARFDISSDSAMDQLLPADMGYDVIVTTPVEDGQERPVLSPLAQKLVLIDLYRQQSRQSQKIRKYTKLVNLFKKLNPSFTAVDSIREAVTELASPELSLFENSTQLFDETQVWSVLREMLGDLHGQSERLFLERTPQMSSFVDLFKDLYYDKTQFTADLVSIVGLHRFVNTHNQEPEKLSSPLYQQDTRNMRYFQTSEAYFGISTDPNVSTVGEDLRFLSKKFPKMKLLSFYHMRLTAPLKQKTKYYDKSGKLIGLRGEIYAEQLNRGKTTGELSEQLIDEHLTLLRDPDPKVQLLARKLLYAEFFRNGLQDRPGSALRTLDQTMLRGIATHVEQFSRLLLDAGKTPDMLPAQLQGFFETSDQKLELVLDEMLLKLTYGGLQHSQNAKIALAEPFKVKAKNGKRPALLQLARGNETKDLEADLARTLAFALGENPDEPRALEKYSSALTQPGEERVSLYLHAEGTAGINQDILNHLAATLGIAQVGTNETYQFPMVFKAGSKQGAVRVHYRLVEIDGQPLTQRLLEAMSTAPETHDREGNPIPEDAQRPPLVNLEGRSAVYEVLPVQLGSQIVSHLGLPASEGKRHAQLVAGDVDLHEPAPESDDLDGFDHGPVLQMENVATEPIQLTPKGSTNQYTVYRDETGVLHVKDATGQELSSGPAFNAVVKSYKDVYLDEFKKGARITEEYLGENADELLYIGTVAHQGMNPQQIAEVWESVAPAELTPREQIIRDNLTSTTEESMRRFSDVNVLNPRIRANYITPTGTPLDVQAQQMSYLFDPNDEQNDPITEEDLVNFMTTFQGGTKTATPQPGMKEKLADRFQQITGLTLDQNFADRLLGREIEMNEQAVRAGSSDLKKQMQAAKLRQQLAVAPRNNVMEVGRIVKYLGNTYIVTEQNPTTGMWTLRNPLASGPASIRTLKDLTHVVVTQHKGTVVFYSGKEFLVTPNSTVIALDKNTDEARYNDPVTGDRRELLQTLRAIQNLDLDNPRAQQHFFQGSQSQKKLGAAGLPEFIQNARRTADLLVTSVRDGSTMTWEEIAAQLKCL